MRRSPRRTRQDDPEVKKKQITELLRGGDLSDTSSSSDDDTTSENLSNSEEEEKKMFKIVTSSDLGRRNKPFTTPQQKKEIIMVSDSSDVEEIQPKKPKETKKQKPKKKEGPKLQIVESTQIPERFEITHDSSSTQKKTQVKQPPRSELTLIMNEHNVKENSLKPHKETFGSDIFLQTQAISPSPKKVTKNVERPPDSQYYGQKLSSVFDIPSSESSEPFTKETQPMEFSRADSLPIYFMNLYEEGNRLFIFGKYRADQIQYGTICVLVNHPVRSLYFLPTDPDKMPYLEATVKEMFKDDFVKMERIKRMTIEDSTQKEWLEVTISANYKLSEIKSSGKFYSDVYGVSATLSENFFLKKKIKGQRWLNIRCSQSYTNHTTTPLFVCDSYDDISLNDELSYKPSMNICVFSLYSTSNVSESIYMISARIFYQWNIEKFEQYRGLNGGHNVQTFCLNTIKNAKNNSNLKTSIIYCDTEEDLLNHFFERLERYDIDFLVSYDLIEKDLSLLMSRGQNLPSLYSLGRIRRVESIKTVVGITAGRILLDLKSFYKNVLQVKSSTFSELVRSELRVNLPLLDLNSLYQQLNKQHPLNNIIGLSRKETQLIQNLIMSRNLIVLCISISRISGCSLQNVCIGDFVEIIEQQLNLTFDRTYYMIPDRRLSMSISHLNSGDFLSDCVKFSNGIFDCYLALFEFNDFFLNVIRENNLCLTNISGNRQGKGYLPKVFSEYENSIQKLIEKPTKSSSDEELIQNKCFIEALKSLGSMFELFFIKGSRRYDINKLRDAVREKSLKTINNLINVLGEGQIVWCDKNRLLIQSDKSDREEALSFFSQFCKRFNDSHRRVKIELDSLLKKAIVVNRNFISIDGDEKLRTNRFDNQIRYRMDWCRFQCQLYDKIIQTILSSENAKSAGEKVTIDITSFLDKLRKDTIKHLNIQDLSINIDLNETNDDQISSFVNDLRNKNRLPILESVISGTFCRSGTNDGKSFLKLTSEVADSSFVDIPFYRSKILETASIVLSPFDDIKSVVAQKYYQILENDHEISCQCHFCTKRFIFKDFDENGNILCPLCSTKQNEKWAVNQLIQSTRNYIHSKMSCHLVCNEYLCKANSFQVLLQGSQEHTDPCNESGVCKGAMTLRSSENSSVSMFMDLIRLFSSEKESFISEAMTKHIRKLASFHNIDLEKRSRSIISDTGAYPIYSSSQSDVCSFLSQ
ncbi:DNA polymerase family B, exonuclease domain containing protein [Trichomonas vaginalis G3]|uniref:DNA polymerase family B, exonuclease domain containing protein n=1 Tax=Trichomonas vaginalis (strain ATCC PRA-98 / G3) TaxID=412133 RepID=A2DDP5_TRIV3|nr:DNA polymerase alpha catalytic subunit family [Trichomonas vaginalis G3]EAY21421.1 DNA polymerase family B, exonuclease domain containing protein [Trichomonas vaginalis G3]KAI5490633.1 DNA polymerase alpha catalytic subunit family [Trichomonas vaginalis G3]|eukprot:XP_001582407.1 DNA polymerase family B, exonuclease domain containing protein [Trichomonas vaginalis G3]